MVTLPGLSHVGASRSERPEPWLAGQIPSATWRPRQSASTGLTRNTVPRGRIHRFTRSRWQAGMPGHKRDTTTAAALSGKLLRQAEAPKDAGSAKRSDGADAGPLPGEHVQGDREIAVLPRAELVGAEGQLPVGPGRHVAQARGGSGRHEPRPGQGVAA